MRTVLIAFALMLVGPIYANAGCIWEFECDSWGNCRQVPLCDSTLDIVPPRSPAIAPIPAPTIRPIPQPIIPPLGTSSCRQAYLCDSWGSCRWETVCQ